MTLHPVAIRLALREYVPFGSWLLTWFLIGFSIGPADVVRLIGVNAVVQGARALCTLEVRHVLARRAAAGDSVWRSSRWKAFKIDLGGLAACAVFLAAVVSLVAFRNMPEAAGMIAIAALGIPARHPLGLLVARRKWDVTWRVGTAVTAVAGSVVIFGFGLPWQAAAVVIALREWGGLIATALFADPRDPARADRSEVLTFAEAAAKTEGTARRQLSYRLVKTLSGVIFGPIGNIAARTGRGAGRMDSKLSRLVPRNRPAMMLFTAGCATAALALIFASREPLAFLVAAAFTRLAASGGAALLWWRYGGVSEDEDDDSDD
ncbi:MAG: hypothetical protein WKF52_11070 [Sphingomicrobium sp.]